MLSAWFFGITKVWPLTPGLTSKKANAFSLSPTLKLGISPLAILQKMHSGIVLTLFPSKTSLKYCTQGFLLWLSNCLYLCRQSAKASCVFLSFMPAFSSFSVLRMQLLLFARVIFSSLSKLMNSQENAGFTIFL